MEILKKPIVKNIITNIICLIIITIYLIIFNIQITALNSAMLTKIVDISSMIILFISIIIFEIGYKYDKRKIFIIGFEFLILAIFTLLIKHMPKVLGETMKSYTAIGTYLFIAYYILKVAIIYTKHRQDELKSLSDIKEIVKEEPTKKVAKRKNKKEEGK